LESCKRRRTRLKQSIKVRIAIRLTFLETAAFKSKMKNHYKGEFNAAAVLKAKPDWDGSEEEDKE
jgi:hypothetical protein